MLLNYWQLYIRSCAFSLRLTRRLFRARAAARAAARFAGEIVELFETTGCMVALACAGRLNALPPFFSSCMTLALNVANDSPGSGFTLSTLFIGAAPFVFVHHAPSATCLFCPADFSFRHQLRQVASQSALTPRGPGNAVQWSRNLSATNRTCAAVQAGCACNAHSAHGSGRLHVRGNGVPRTT